MAVKEATATGQDELEALAKLIREGRAHIVVRGDTDLSQVPKCFPKVFVGYPNGIPHIRDKEGKLVQLIPRM